MTTQRIAVLGAGAAGLGAAAALSDQDVVLYEQRESFGGHASSFAVDGFRFDEGPHISFTRNEKIRKLFAEGVAGEYREFPAVAHNYFAGHILRHPAQCHLYPLPVDLKQACLVDFVQARLDKAAPIENYRDWCYHQFGRSFAERFVRLYTRKYWTLELEELTTDWVGPRIHPPSVEEIIEGALRETGKDYTYISTFRYPVRGGFVSFFQRLAAGKTIKCGHEVIRVHPHRRRLDFRNGAVEHYDQLVSTLPLPELIGMIEDAPSAVREASARLRCTSHFLVSVGVRGDHPSEAYWIYYYDEDVPFSRVSFPTKFSPDNGPVGHWSLQAEIVHAPHRPLGDAEAVVARTLESLTRVGLLERTTDIVAVHGGDIRYANVIFDTARAAATRLVHDYLRAQGIVVCGRYGDWAYLWTDDSIVSGERAARDVRALITGAPAGVP